MGGGIDVWATFVNCGATKVIEFVKHFCKFMPPPLFMDWLDEHHPDWRDIRRELMIDAAYGTLTGTINADMMDRKYRLQAAKIGLDHHAKLEIAAMSLDYNQRLRDAEQRLADYERGESERNARLASTRRDRVRKADFKLALVDRTIHGPADGGQQS